MHDVTMHDYADLYRRTMLAMMIAEARGLGGTAQNLCDAAEAFPPDAQGLARALDRAGVLAVDDTSMADGRRMTASAPVQHRDAGHAASLVRTL